MDGDTWGVAMLGEGSVGKTALVVQVRKTLRANSQLV
jgi:nicotinamide riboside kinase